MNRSIAEVRRNYKKFCRWTQQREAVAAKVNGGAADVGLGILAAARALGLDFVPLLREQYDLAIPRGHYESDLVQGMLVVLRSKAFVNAVARLGGYDVAGMGNMVSPES